MPCISSNLSWSTPNLPNLRRTSSVTAAICMNFSEFSPAEPPKLRIFVPKPDIVLLSFIISSPENLALDPNSCMPEIVVGKMPANFEVSSLNCTTLSTDLKTPSAIAPKPLARPPATIPNTPKFLPISQAASPADWNALPYLPILFSALRIALPKLITAA